MEATPPSCYAYSGHSRTRTVICAGRQEQYVFKESAARPLPELSTSITLVTTHLFAILHLAIILLGVSHV